MGAGGQGALVSPLPVARCSRVAGSGADCCSGLVLRGGADRRVPTSSWRCFLVPQVRILQRTMQHIGSLHGVHDGKDDLDADAGSGLRLWRRSSLLQQDRGGDSLCRGSHSATHSGADCRHFARVLERIQQRTLAHIADLPPWCLRNAFATHSRADRRCRSAQEILDVNVGAHLLWTLRTLRR